MGRISLFLGLRTTNFAVSFSIIFSFRHLSVLPKTFLDYFHFAISTDALAEAKEALANVGNAEILRKENQELFQENRKLKSDLESAQKLLETTQSKAKEQAEKDAESIRLLQDTFGGSPSRDEGRRRSAAK